jgi:hypothetical protein
MCKRSASLLLVVAALELMGTVAHWAQLELLCRGAEQANIGRPFDRLHFGKPACFELGGHSDSSNSSAAHDNTPNDIVGILRAAQPQSASTWLRRW